VSRILVGSIYGRSSIKNAHFFPIRKQTWPPQAIVVSDWSIYKKSSPLKPLDQMNWNLVGSIYARSSVQIDHFVSIRLETWPPQAILVSDFCVILIKCPFPFKYCPVRFVLLDVKSRTEQFFWERRVDTENTFCLDISDLRINKLKIKAEGYDTNVFVVCNKDVLVSCPWLPQCLLDIFLTLYTLN
jgi:hypothetical protein